MLSVSPVTLSFDSVSASLSSSSLGPFSLLSILSIPELEASLTSCCSSSSVLAISSVTLSLDSASLPCSSSSMVADSFPDVLT
jgi:hypothetical protein